MKFRTIGLLLLRRDGASCCRHSTNHPRSTGNYTNSDCRNQTADRRPTCRGISKRWASLFSRTRRAASRRPAAILYQMSGSTEVVLGGGNQNAQRRRGRCLSLAERRRR